MRTSAPTTHDIEERIAAHQQRVLTLIGEPRTGMTGGPRGKPCTLTRLADGAKFNFVSVGQAALFARVKRSSLNTMLNRTGNCAAGYRWRLGDAGGKRP